MAEPRQVDELLWLYAQVPVKMPLQLALGDEMPLRQFANAHLPVALFDTFHHVQNRVPRHFQTVEEEPVEVRHEMPEGLADVREQPRLELLHPVGKTSHLPHPVKKCESPRPELDAEEVDLALQHLLVEALRCTDEVNPLVLHLRTEVQRTEIFPQIEAERRTPVRQDGHYFRLRQTAPEQPVFVNKRLKFWRREEGLKGQMVGDFMVK